MYNPGIDGVVCFTEEDVRGEGFTPQGRVLGAVMLQEPNNRIYTTVKDFCKHWNIKRSDFYKGLKNLPEYVHYELLDGSLVLWHTDIKQAGKYSRPSEN